MPLIEQQDVVNVCASPGTSPTTAHLITQLKRVLEDYPPVRIVALTESVVASNDGTGPKRSLTAVVETV